MVEKRRDLQARETGGRWRWEGKSRVQAGCVSQVTRIKRKVRVDLTPR